MLGLGAGPTGLAQKTRPAQVRAFGLFSKSPNPIQAYMFVRMHEHDGTKMAVDSAVSEPIWLLHKFDFQEIGFETPNSLNVIVLV
jgi:hypothetical protein